MDKITIRLEAARIAAQVEGVTTKNFTATARRIEHYVTGSTQVTEHFSEEDVIRRTIHEAMLEMTGANDTIRRFKELDKEFHEKYKDGTLPQDNADQANENTEMGRKEDLYVFSNGLVMRKQTPDPLPAVDRQHDPNFVSDLMKAFATYPAKPEDFNQAARHRQELYHDLGLNPKPFDKRDIAYLAPGGMPSSEAESIFLQENGEKVE